MEKLCHIPVEGKGCIWLECHHCCHYRCCHHYHYAIAVTIVVTVTVIIAVLIVIGMVEWVLVCVVKLSLVGVEEGGMGENALAGPPTSWVPPGISPSPNPSSSKNTAHIPLERGGAGPGGYHVSALAGGVGNQVHILQKKVGAH